MRRSLVVGLDVHSLFRQGIAQLLHSGSDLDVPCLPMRDESLHARLKRWRPRVICKPPSGWVI